MNSRVVYRTGVGRVCPECGQPEASCRCRTRAPEGPIPERLTARLRLEQKGRGGKRVTVVDGLPDHPAFLAELAAALKRTCGVGGTVRTGAIELAGDVRERLGALLAERGIRVKG